MEIPRQLTNSLFDISVEVVDNDYRKTAWDVVREFAKDNPLRIGYHIVEEPNISLARNCALKNSRGNYFAFIDDDEFPSPQWLLCLYNTLRDYGVEGVLGPVVPHFEAVPPHWLVKSGICERSRHKTGTTMRRRADTRTGNVLFAGKIIECNSTPFNPKYGKTGGEDADFFDRMMRMGATFVWCDEAVVYETVSPDRYKKVYHVKRALIQGVTSARHYGVLSKDTLKSVLAITVYAIALPVLFFGSQSAFVKYLLKGCNHAGKLLARLGYKPVKAKP